MLVRWFQLRRAAVLLSVVMLLALVIPFTSAAPVTFSNMTALTIPATGTNGIASEYPTSINVSGLSGVISDVNVTIHGLTHTHPDDLNLLLVGPTGIDVVLMADVGGSGDVSNIEVTFDQSAASAIGNSGPFGAGSWRPSSVGNDAMPSPAPQPPNQLSLDSYNNTNPNGTWSLYVFDDAMSDVGSMSGWSLIIDTVFAPAITSAASANLLVGDALSHTFTADGSPAPTFSYANENLPPGVTRTGDTLSGAPTAPGVYTIDATATNGIAPDALQTFTITVTGDAPTITSPASANLLIGDPFSHTFTAVGNPSPTLSYSNENLPPGVTRTGDTLSGAPTAPGVYSIDATASNGVMPDALQTFTITVTGDAPIITSIDTIYVEEEQMVNHTFTAMGDPVPTLSYSGINLPDGVTLVGDTLSGAPMLAGTYSVNVTASNGVMPDAEQTFRLIVGERPEPPASPFAEDVNFDESDTVRTGIPDHLVDAINVRTLYSRGAPVVWLSGDLYHSGNIGIQGVLDMGVWSAIDIFSPNGLNYFDGGAVFCLQGEGTLVWMAARHQPRIAEIIGSYTVPEFPGYTCATLFEPGMLVLTTGSN